MDLKDSPKPEVDYVSIVVTTVDGHVDEIRAFGDQERAAQVCENIREKEPWKEVERENFRLPGHLEDKREDYIAWKRSQMEDGE